MSSNPDFLCFGNFADRLCKVESIGARDSFDRIQGGGGGGGARENFTYGDGIRYNIIMRCDPVSYNLI